MISVLKKCKFVVLFLTLIILVVLPMSLHAEDALPQALTAQLHAPLVKIGSGTFRKFGFSIYKITLWAPGGSWSDKKPYALQLHYTHSVSKDTLVDTVMDDIRDQNVGSESQLTTWEKMLNDTMPSVEDGDALIGLAIPGKKSLLFFNGKKLTSIDDPVFSDAFFNIWLGETADESLRDKLLGIAK